MTSKLCPLCGGKIPKEKIEEFESKFKDQESKIKEQVEEKWKEKIEEEKKHGEKELKQQKELFDVFQKTLEKQSKDERKRLEKDLTERFKEKTKSIDKEMANLEKELKKAKDKEKNIRDEIKTELEKDNQSKIKSAIEEKDKEIIAVKQKYAGETEKLKADLETLKRQLENKTPSELGEEGQAEVLDVLIRNFPRDDISETKRGKAGSDIFHKIIYNGEAVGLIVYEVKNVNNWNNDFIEQVKGEKTKHCAHYAILVTNIFPAKEKTICERDGIIVVCPSKASIIAREVRNFLIESHKAKLTGEEIEEKIKILQDYLTSPEYKNTLSDLANAIKEWRDIREKEKSSHERHWAEEENLNDKIDRGTAKIHHKIASIIETKTPKIPIAISHQHPKKLKKEI